jgi:hypothetical protein
MDLLLVLPRGSQGGAVFPGGGAALAALLRSKAPSQSEPEPFNYYFSVLFRQFAC